MSVTSSETTTGTARMWREGQFVTIQPPCLDVLGPVLQTRACRCRQGPQGQLQAGYAKVAMFSKETYAGSKVLKFWDGLTPVVLAALHLAGRPVRVSGGLHHAYLPLPEGKDFLDSPFLDHISQHDRGLIHYHGEHVQPARLIAQMAKAWPELNLTAVTACRDEVYALVRQLRAQGIDAFGFTGRNQPLVEARVAVATFGGMAFNSIEPEKQDIVIALDAVEVTAKHPLWCLGHLDRARLYGLVDMRRRLSHHEEDLVRCLFGFEEVVVPGHGQQLRGVEVLWVQGVGRRLKHDAANNMVSKRYGLWHNEGRNRQIARLARAFAAGDKEALGKVFPAKVMSLLPTKPARIFLLVENVEHALAVMPKLPGWPVIASGLVNLDGLEPQQRADLEGRLVSRMAPSPTTLHCAIVTQAGLHTTYMPVKDMDVLVRADGGIGLPSLPEAALVHPTTEHGLPPLLVVDVDDGHHPDLQRSARRRRHAYDAAGWPPLGTTVDTLNGREYLKRHLGLHQKGGRQ